MSVTRRDYQISGVFPGLTNQEFGAICAQFRNRDMNWYLPLDAIRREGDKIVINAGAAGRDANGAARQIEGLFIGFLLGRKGQ